MHPALLAFISSQLIWPRSDQQGETLAKTPNPSRNLQDPHEKCMLGPSWLQSFHSAWWPGGGADLHQPFTPVFDPLHTQ